jgi:hypothetical protein
MNNLFSKLGSAVPIVFFVIGYFPVNMILAFVYGDKLDVVISLFVPFYGFVVMVI